MLLILTVVTIILNSSTVFAAKIGTYRRIFGTFATAITLLSPLQPVLADEAEYLQSLAAVIETKEVLQPVLGFVKSQAYNNARTNIKYCLNQLRLQKNLDALVKNSIDFSDDADAIDAAADASTRITNTATQLDSTAYTLVFIPTDEDGIAPPSAEKYVKEIGDFYGALDSDLNTMLKVATDAQLAEAKVIAEKAIKEIAPALKDVLFKDATRRTTL